MNLSIVDFDSLLFHSATDSLEESIIKLKDKVENIIEKTEADYWCGFVTSGKCFRYNIFLEYKQNRTRPLPKYFKALKEYAVAEYNLNQCVEYEADDAVKYWYNQDLIIGFSKYEDGSHDTNETFADISVQEYLINHAKLNKTICAIDKDILQSVPGKHFNYTYKLEDKTNPDSVVKGWWVECKENPRFFWKQMLMGDSSDGIKSIPNVGEVKAQKYLDQMIEVNSDTINYENWVLDAYVNHYGTAQGIYEYSKNYRLLHMLGNDDDFMREVGHLPEFPKINKVNKVVKEIIDF